MEREYLWGTNSLADIAETLTKSVQYLETNNGHGAALTSEFKHNLSTTLQELSLRITQLSSGGERKTVSGKEISFQHYILTKFSCFSLKFLYLKKNAQKSRENVAGVAL